MSDADGLAAWYAACLDKAEALAKATSAETWAVRNLGRHDSAAIVIPRRTGTHGLVLGPAIGTFDGHSHSADDAAFAASVDPKHRLDDIALKRAILALHEHRELSSGQVALFGCRLCENELEYGMGWCETVRQLGTEFSGKPGYLEEWKP